MPFPTLNCGGPVVWMSGIVARPAGIVDNDRVEVFIGILIILPGNFVELLPPRAVLDVIGISDGAKPTLASTAGVMALIGARCRCSGVDIGAAA